MKDGEEGREEEAEGSAQEEERTAATAAPQREGGERDQLGERSRRRESCGAEDPASSRARRLRILAGQQQEDGGQRRRHPDGVDVAHAGDLQSDQRIPGVPDGAPRRDAQAPGETEEEGAGRQIGPQRQGLPGEDGKRQASRYTERGNREGGIDRGHVAVGEVLPVPVAKR